MSEMWIGRAARRAASGARVAQAHQAFKGVPVANVHGSRIFLLVRGWRGRERGKRGLSFQGRGATAKTGGAELAIVW